LSICGGRQRERADAEDERCHDGKLDLGHLSSPCFKPPRGPGPFRVAAVRKGSERSNNPAKFKKTVRPS
jgi:hypothetical protein